MKTMQERVQEAVKILTDKDMTVIQIAAACKVSRQAFNNWKNGEDTDLKARSLIPLSDLSGLSAYRIVTGRGSKTGLSKEEKIILEAFSLFGDESRQGWLSAAKARIDQESSSRKQA